MAEKIANLMFSNDEANHELADCLIISQTKGCSEDEFRSVITEILTILYNRIEFFDFFKGLEQKAKDKFNKRKSITAIIPFFVAFFDFFKIHPYVFLIFRIDIRYKTFWSDFPNGFDYPKDFDTDSIFEGKHYFLTANGSLSDKWYYFENFVWNPSIIIPDAVENFIKKIKLYGLS